MVTAERIVVIGAGVAGLSAARYLGAQGFDVTILESHDDLGGQWNWRNPRSGVWPQMRTNTAACLTKLSDVQYPDEVALFPRNGEVLAMLDTFAEAYDLRSRTVFGAEVTRVGAGPGGGWEVTWVRGGETSQTQVERVVVASGRFTRPSIPPVEGLSGFGGTGGVTHTFDYDSPERYRGARVVVGGSNISSLEIACDLAMAGAARVILTQRRQRYVLPKVVAGSPVEYHMLTRGRALDAESRPAPEQSVATRELILRIAGDPARYGAPAPHPDPARAGVTLSQHYLSLVAEDRIDVRPWLAAVDGTTVTFTDGSSSPADAIILGTGFDLDLPFLDDRIRRTLQCSRAGLVLSDFTFHPELEGLAFLGLWAQRGPYPVVLEQQARYLAYAWGGSIPAPTPAELQRGLRACVEEDHHGGYRQQNEMAIRFARLAGVDPAGLDDPDLQRLLRLSAVTGEMFRLTGPDARPDAEALLRRDFARHAPAESVLASQPHRG